MKRILTLIALLSCATFIFAQDVKKIPHGYVFNMKHLASRADTAIVEGVRIGEYFWTTQNQNYNHITLGPGNNWTQLLEDERDIPMSTFQKYFTDNNLDTQHLGKFTSEEFKKYYGRHYNHHSFFGNWVYHARYRMPMNESSDYFDMKTREKYPIYTSVYGWRLPTVEYYQQLFAMSKFSNPVASTQLTGKDIRIDLGARTGENPLAIDIKTKGSTNSPYNWFATSVNRYGFSLMPAGKTKNNETDFTNLFKEAVFPAYVGESLVNHGAGMPKAMITLNDNGISYVDPTLVRTWVAMSKEWATTRMVRRLSPAELGYELYVNYYEEDIIKVAVDEYGEINESLPTGYKVLEPGYLRGFYCQYFIYTDKHSANSGYTAKDMFRFAQCVKDPTLPEPDCDCDNTAYLTNHLVLETGIKDNHILYKDETFKVRAVSNNQAVIKIGVFNLTGELIERVDVSRVGDIYTCKLANASSNRRFTLRVYTESPEGIILIGRSLKSDPKSHLVDQLHVYILNSKNTRMMDAKSPEARAMRAVRAADGSLLASHIEPMFDEDREALHEFTYAVKQYSEDFKIFIPYDENNKREIAIGLFTAGGEYLTDVDFELDDDEDWAEFTFTCQIPKKTADGARLNDATDYAIIPYYKESGAQGKVSRMSQAPRECFVDRLPIYLFGRNEGLPTAKAIAFSAEVEEEDLLNAIIYPNPVSDSFTITGDFEEVREVKVYTTTGAPVKTVKNTNRVDVSAIPAGVYKVTIETEKGNTSKTIKKY